MLNSSYNIYTVLLKFLFVPFDPISFFFLNVNYNYISKFIYLFIFFFFIFFSLRILQAVIYSNRRVTHLVAVLEVMEIRVPTMRWKIEKEDIRVPIHLV